MSNSQVTTESKNALDRYNIKPTRKYECGCAYFLLGPGPTINWEVEAAKKQLKTEPNYYFDLSSAEVSSLAELVDPMGDTTYLFVVVSDDLQELNPRFRPDANCCLIVCIDTGPLERTDQKKKVEQYEPVNSEYIKVIDLTKYSFLDRKVFKDWYHTLDERQQNIVDLYAQNPWQLCRFLFEEESIDSTDVEDYKSDKDLDDVNYLLDSLGSVEGVEDWYSLDRGTAYRLFLTPEQEYSGGYLILAGGPGSPKRRGLKNTSLEKWHDFMPSLANFRGEFTINSGKCPELWYYFRRFSKIFLERWKYLPHYFLLVFSSWVYVASNRLANKYHRGFEKRTSKRGKTYYVFNPSKKAVRLLERLLDA